MLFSNRKKSIMLYDGIPHLFALYNAVPNQLNRGF